MSNDQYSGRKAGTSEKDTVQKNLSRRQFLSRTTAAALFAASLKVTDLAAAEGKRERKFHSIPSSPLPVRDFGSTGVKVPILTFGSGSRWMMYEDDDWAVEIMHRAIDSGIRYIDTAHVYGQGRSETLIGRVMPERRTDVLLQTKIQTRDHGQWWKDLELSLERMHVDYVDMLLIHSLQHEEDLAAVEAKGGPLEQLYRAKEQGLARWIGVSSHTDSGTLARFLGRHKVDGVQMALNVATNGPHDLGFEEKVLPLAKEQGLAVIAMKVMGQDRIANKYEQFPADKCLRYSLSLPVASATVGMPRPEHLEQNLAVAKNFQPYSEEEMKRIKQEAEKEIKTAFGDFMRGHVDVA